MGETVWEDSGNCEISDILSKLATFATFFN